MAPEFNSENEKFVEVPGGKIFVKTWVPTQIVDPTPLILFHDSLGCVTMWREFPADVSEKLGKVVIAYDRLGFGQSTERVELPSANFVNEEAELYFPALIQSLSIKKFDLFGHSVGGGMAIACAARIEGCRSVVTESAQAFVESRTVEGISKAKEEFKDPKYFERLAKYHGTKAAWVLRAWTDVWLSREFAPWSLKPELSKVRCPVLAIHGDRDEYGSQAFPEMMRDFAGGPSEMVIVSNCGHVPHRETPDVVLELMTKFYQQVAASM